MAINLVWWNAEITWWYDTGNVSSVTYSGSNVTIFDTSKTWTVNELSGRIIFIVWWTWYWVNKVTTSRPITSNTATSMQIGGWWFVSYDKVTREYSNADIDATTQFLIANNLQDIVDAWLMTVDWTLDWKTYTTTHPIANKWYLWDFSKTLIIKDLSLQFWFFEQSLFWANCVYQFWYIYRDSFTNAWACTIVINNQPGLWLIWLGSYLWMGWGRIKNFPGSNSLEASLVWTEIEAEWTWWLATLNWNWYFDNVKIASWELQLTWAQTFKNLTLNWGQLIATTSILWKWFDLRQWYIWVSAYNYFIIDSLFREVKFDSFAFLHSVNLCTSIELKTFDSSLNTLWDIKYHVKDIN